MEPITSSQPATTAASAAPTKSNEKAQEQKNQFLQLLVAQLKGQNPLNPMEGSEFVAQLAQFSSLEELTQIRSGMDSVKQLLSAQNEMYLNQPKELF
jgi:flagellar basal-body rod modification protein FlgD